MCILAFWKNISPSEYRDQVFSLLCQKFISYNDLAPPFAIMHTFVLDMLRPFQKLCQPLTFNTRRLVNDKSDAIHR
jgi:hypothetical protein